MNQTRLDQVREKYNDLNDLPLKARLIKASPIELWTIETLNHHGVTYNGVHINNWKKCRTRDDRTFKRDAEAVVDGSFVYAQLKFRQPNSGTDVGCAIIQPYPGAENLRQIFRDERDRMDAILARDYKFEGIIYACLNSTWDKLILLPYRELVRPAYMEIFEEWLLDPDSQPLDRYDRTFCSNRYSGAQLKWTVDKGSGFDAGQEKIICYLPMSLFENDSRVSLVDMIDPPHYV